MPTLLDHNQLALENLSPVLKETNCCCVVQPTGTGKSYLMDAVIGPKTALVVAPSNPILEQWKLLFDDDGSRDIDYSTYASLHKHNGSNYDIVVLDEFHRTGGKSWGRSARRVKRQVLDAGGMFFGVSATPKHNTRGCMVELMFDGNKAHELTLKEAFDDDILIAPLYIAAHYKADELINDLASDILKLRNISDGRKNTMLARLESAKKRSNHMGGISKIIMRHLPKRPKGIIFAVDCKHADEIAEEAIAWFPGKTVNVSKVYSKPLAEPPMQIIRDFSKAVCAEGEVELIVSVGMLNEGIHAAGANFCIFMRPTKSHIVYHQQLGRVLSAGHNEQVVVFDFVNNVKTLKEVKLVSDGSTGDRIGSEGDVKKDYERKGVEPMTGIEIIGTDPDFYDLLEDIEITKRYKKPDPVIPLKDALRWCREKGLYCKLDLVNFKGTGSRRPQYFPKDPTDVWNDFWQLVASNLLTAAQARAWCISKNLFNERAYVNYLECNPDATSILPRTPHEHYQNGFDWSDIQDKRYSESKSIKWMKKNNITNHGDFVTYSFTNKNGQCFLVPELYLNDKKFWDKVV
jgi:superfamily II DNA or RNA helicase